MIANILNVVAAPRSARIVRGELSERRIRAVFGEIRDDLGATTSHMDLRQPDKASGVVWSLWIGHFQKAAPWILSDRHQETRYGCLLLLEHDGFIAVLTSNVGDVADSIAEDRVSYQKFLAVYSTPDTEVESISTRTLRAARAGVTRNTQTGRHLQDAIPRVGANQSALSQLSLRKADKSRRVSPGSGRVTLSGGRATIPELCAWFAATCADINEATEASDFIKAFAHPIALSDLPENVEPTALQLDPSVVDDLITQGVTLSRTDVALSDAEIEALRVLIRELWLVDPQRTVDDVEASIWRLKAGPADVGRITKRIGKISLTAEALSDIKVEYIDGKTENLNQVFNGSDQPFRLTFSDPTYGYAAGQLFRDHRLLGNRDNLLGVLTPTLAPGARDEKGHAQGQFTPDSLFGFVVNQGSAGDEFLVCEDIGTELADFIGIAPRQHQVTFYHCKGGQTNVGASGLQEVVSQATKNLGFMTASPAELERRAARWNGRWNQTTVPRLQRGATVEAFISAFSRAVAAPQATRRVVLVTSSLSKVAVTEAFEALGQQGESPEAAHVLWLLSGFVDQCRSIGAVPEIVCRP